MELRILLISLKNRMYMNIVKLFSLMCIVFASFSAFGQLGGDFKLPETWGKDFVITLSYHSSMSGGKTDVKFTFDSCTYTNQSHHSKKPKARKFKMKEADRVAILKRLAELNVDQIKSEHSMHAVHDGWSQSICFGTYCIEGGTSAEMSDTDKNQFLEAYRYLEEYAMIKKKGSR